MEEPEYWTSAVEKRYQEAEERFQNGGELNDLDMVVTALSHPDKFEIFVRPVTMKGRVNL